MSCRLLRRALKVLTDREVSPAARVLEEHDAAARLDVPERTYGASTFRDFRREAGVGRS
jgi:hypothetical protein